MENLRKWWVQIAFTIAVAITLSLATTAMMPGAIPILDKTVGAIIPPTDYEATKAQIHEERMSQREYLNSLSWEQYVEEKGYEIDEEVEIVPTRKPLTQGAGASIFGAKVVNQEEDGKMQFCVVVNRSIEKVELNKPYKGIRIQRGIPGLEEEFFLLKL